MERNIEDVDPQERPDETVDTPPAEKPSEDIPLPEEEEGEHDPEGINPEDTIPPRK